MTQELKVSMDNKEDLELQIKKIDDSISRYSYVKLFGIMLIIGSVIYTFFTDPVTGFIAAIITIVPWLIVDSMQTDLYMTKKSLLANRKDILPILNEYCSVEKFDADSFVSGGQMKEFFGRCIDVGYGRNYLKAIIDCNTVETSYIYLSSPHGHTGYSKSFFSGQIAILTTQESFPGRLLIIRSKTYDKAADGTALRNFYDFEYNNIVYNMLLPDKGAMWIWTLNDRLNDTAVFVSGSFEQIWRVHSTNSQAAKQLLRKGTKLRNFLSNNSRIAFVLYDNNRIVFGGNYDYDLTDNTSTDISKESKAAIKAFFNEAIPSVTEDIRHITYIDESEMTQRKAK